MKKSVKNQTVLNNPGADDPIYYWFKIPAEGREYPWTRRRVRGPTGNQT